MSDALLNAPSATAAPLPPPRLVRGPIAWIRDNLLSSPLNIALTLFGFYLVYLLVPPLVHFLIIDAVWTGVDREACLQKPGGPPVGACWAYVADRINFFTYGSYPVGERWRVNVVFVLFAVAVAWVLWP